MEEKLYEMTILAENSEKFQKCLKEEYSEKLTVKKEVPVLPYMIYHLHTNDISRMELAKLQDRFLFL